MSDLTIIVVNWNTRNLLLECVESVIAETYAIDWQLVIVDNNSSDDSLEQIASIVEGNSRIQIIRSPINLGFAGGNNVGLLYAHGRYVVLLNPDTRVLDGALTKAVAYLDDNPRVGAMGPKLLNADGSLQPSIGSFPTLKGMFWETTRLRKLFPGVRLFSSFKRLDMDYSLEQEVEQPSGACLFLRAEALKQVGNMDERFFMYYEEVDLCYRIHAAGWSIRYVPWLQVVHVGGQSSAFNLDVRIVENARSKLLYYIKRNPTEKWNQLVIRLLILIEAFTKFVLLMLVVPLRRHSWREIAGRVARYGQVARLSVTNVNALR